jgi:hypothetical protein
LCARQMQGMASAWWLLCRSRVACCCTSTAATFLHHVIRRPHHWPQRERGFCWADAQRRGDGDVRPPVTRRTVAFGCPAGLARHLPLSTVTAGVNLTCWSHERTILTLAVRVFEGKSDICDLRHEFGGVLCFLPANPFISRTTNTLSPPTTALPPPHSCHHTTAANGAGDACRHAAPLAQRAIPQMVEEEHQGTDMQEEFAGEGMEQEEGGGGDADVSALARRLPPLLLLHGAVFVCAVATQPRSALQGVHACTMLGLRSQRAARAARALRSCCCRGRGPCTLSVYAFALGRCRCVRVRSHTCAHMHTHAQTHMQPRRSLQS